MCVCASNEEGSAYSNVQTAVSFAHSSQLVLPRPPGSRSLDIHTAEFRVSIGTPGHFWQASHASWKHTSAISFTANPDRCLDAAQTHVPYNIASAVSLKYLVDGDEGIGERISEAKPRRLQGMQHNRDRDPARHGFPPHPMPRRAFPTRAGETGMGGGEAEQQQGPSAQIPSEN